MRSDGRGVNQLRPVNMVIGFSETSLGSVLMEMGRTRVLCTASIEDRVPPFLIGKNTGWLTAEYAMLPGSSTRRVARETASGKVNSRSREIQRLIGRSLRTAVDLDKIGERTIYLDCDVLQADGGTRTAAITGAFVALKVAVGKLVKDGIVAEDPIVQSVAAISVGVVDGNVLLDLCYEEDVRASTDMNIVMNNRNEFIEIQGTAESRSFSREESNVMLNIANEGIEQLLESQARFLQD